MKKLWTDIAESSGARIYSLVVGLATLFLSARWLGPGGRGDLVAVTNWVTLFSTLGGLSLGQVAIHRATVLRDRPWMASTLGSLLAIAGVVTTVVWALVAGIYVPSHGHAFKGLSPAYLLIGFAALPFLIWEQYGSALLTAVGQIRIYNRAQFLGRTVGLALFYLLVLRFPFGVMGALIATLVSQTTVSLAGLRYLVTHGGPRIVPDLKSVGELVAGGCKLHLNAIGAFLYTSTDVLLIHQYRGAVETGYYQMAVQMSAVLLLIPQAAALVLFGNVTQDGPDGLWHTQKRVIAVVVGAMALVAGAAALAAPLFLPLVAGKAFTPSVGVFQLLVIGLVAMSFTTLMGPQWIGRGLLWQTAALTLFSGLLNFGANCVLVPRYGMYGSAAATLGTYALSLAVNVAMALWITRHVAAQHARPAAAIGD
jgi:enterobacterial common antigen flippase